MCSRLSVKKTEILNLLGAITLTSVIDSETFESELRDYVQALALKIVIESKPEDSSLCTSTTIREVLKHGKLISYQREITDTILFFKNIGYERIYSILNAITVQSSSSFPVCPYWGTCAFTGLSSSRQLRIEDHNETILIDVIFAPLVYALWLTTHINVLETSRIHRILLKENIQNIQTLQRFMDTKRFLADTTIQNYYSAFSNILTYFRSVRSKLDTQI